MSAIEFLFVPVAINNNPSYNSSHENEIIGIFDESIWSYPSNHYVDPNEDPGPGNALAPRLYYSLVLDAHIQRMADALSEYYGSDSPFFEQPYVTVVRPRKKTIYLESGETELTFEVSPYDQPNPLNYEWFIDGDAQPDTEPEFSHTFDL